MRPTLDKRPGDVASMFDAIAGRYDLTNTVISFGQDRRWRQATVRALAVRHGDVILDLAAGTGVSSEPLDLAGAKVIPCDFSVGMLSVGKHRRPDLPFIAGDATKLPFADASFDAVTISLGLRNVVDTAAALAEMLRVTKPGGRLVITEFSTPVREPLRTIYSTYLMGSLPKIAAAVTKEGGAYQYLADSIAAWPDQESLSDLMATAGWREVAYRNLSGGIVAIHRARRPLGA